MLIDFCFLILILELPLSFTVYSDGMYIGDEPVGNHAIPDNVVLADTDKPVIVEIVSNPYWASVVSQTVLDKIQKLGQILGELECHVISMSYWIYVEMQQMLILQAKM